MSNGPNLFEFFLEQIKQGMFDHSETHGRQELSGMQRLIRATKVEVELGLLTAEQQKELGIQLNMRQSELGRTHRF